ESGAAAQPPGGPGRLEGEVLGVAPLPGGAERTPGTKDTRRAPGRADRGAEIHQGLGEVAGAPRRGKLLGQAPDARLRTGQFVFDCKQTRHDPLDVAVNRHRTGLEGDRRDCGSRIAADSRKPRKGSLVLRKTPAVALDAGAC